VVPLQQFIVELRKRDIPAFNYTDEEAQRELEI
jgi:predicted HTH domain antitoxin